MVSRGDFGFPKVPVKITRVDSGYGHELHSNPWDCLRNFVRGC